MSPSGDQPDGDVRKLVEARLGRPAQDRLEAAVVLEAWGGARPPRGLQIAGDAVDAAPGPPARSVARPAASQPPDRAVVAEGLALVVAIVAVALWTRPFGHALGARVWDDTVRLALPITLGIQWTLRSRYLERAGGLAIMRRDGAAILGVLFVGCAAAHGDGARFAALLTVTWVGGAVLIRRGWGLLYVALLVAVAIDDNNGGDPRRSLATAAAATLLLAILGVATAGTADGAPGRPRRAVAAGLVGAGIGGLLVLDTSVGWGAQGVLPALALVPSTAGSFWGGYHLWHVYEAVPRALAGVPVEQADRATLRSPALVVLSGAFARLAGTTLALSALALLVAAHLAEPPSSAAAAGRIALLGGFGLVALATLLLSLQHSLGFSSWALFTLACALVAESGVAHLRAPPFAGSGLVTGAAVAVLLATPPVIGLFLRPGRVLATILWIA